MATEAECSERTKTFLLDVTDQETVAKATEFVKDALPENAGQLRNIMALCKKQLGKWL